MALVDQKGEEKLKGKQLISNFGIREMMGMKEKSYEQVTNKELTNAITIYVGMQMLHNMKIKIGKG